MSHSSCPKLWVPTALALKHLSTELFLFHQRVRKSFKSNFEFLKEFFLDLVDFFL